MNYALTINTGISTGTPYITATNVDQDYNPNHGGLGVCSQNANCSGSDDSFQSNIGNNAGKDEVLFFDFASAVTLDKIWFNGGHKENVNGSVGGNTANSSNALFQVFTSSNGTNYTNYKFVLQSGSTNGLGIYHYPVDSVVPVLCCGCIRLWPTR